MTSINRRSLLKAGAILAVPGGLAFKPGGRPVLTHGVQSGDPTAGRRRIPSIMRLACDISDECRS